MGEAARAFIIILGPGQSRFCTVENSLAHISCIYPQRY
jgi:hypothetical protein